MSARSRRLVTVGSLSLALALTTPAAAFADHRDEHDPQGPPSEQEADRGSAGSGSGQGGSGQGGSGQGGSGQGGSGQGGSGQGGSGQGGSGQGGSAEKPAGKPSGSGEKAADGTSGSGKERSGEGRDTGGDPRGNNGTVKVDGAPFDDGRGNEPHVGCVFELDFYGFDDGDTATITFTGHAPTGGGLLHSESGTVISTDAAGGGQDPDATLRYSVADELAELLDIAPHPQQGWHVKVAVDVDGAPGGAKQKVFWIDCPTGAPVAGTTTQGATGAGTASGGGGTDVAVTGQSVAPARTFGSGALGVAASADNRVSALSGTTTSAASAESAVAPAAGTVSARSATQPRALPFTGAQGVVALLTLGLAAVGAGALAQRLGRRAGTGDLG